MNNFTKSKYMSIQKYIHEFDFKHLKQKFPLKIDQLTEGGRERERGFINQSSVSFPLKII